MAVGLYECLHILKSTSLPVSGGLARAMSLYMVVALPIALSSFIAASAAAYVEVSAAVCMHSALGPYGAGAAYVSAAVDADADACGAVHVYADGPVSLCAT